MEVKNQVQPQVKTDSEAIVHHLSCSNKKRNKQNNLPNLISHITTSSAQSIWALSHYIGAILQASLNGRLAKLLLVHLVKE